MAKRVYPSAKLKILETAKLILLNEGLGHLTTENLTEKAGLSKGGFFYHFKTKDDLIKALVGMLIEEMEINILSRAGKDPVKKGATLRAYIEFTFSKENDEMTALCRSMVEVLFNDSLKTDDFQAYYSRLVKKMLSEELDKEVATTVMLALDGYWYNEVFGVQVINKKDVKKLFAHLIKLTF